MGEVPHVTYNLDGVTISKWSTVDMHAARRLLAQEVFPTLFLMSEVPL